MERPNEYLEFYLPILEYDNEVELHILTFLNAHRENNLGLYVESLEALAPWFFALDRTHAILHYARWLPVHIRDTSFLSQSVSDTLKKCWVIAKTENKFSSISVDQAHEQNNAVLKGKIGLTENPVDYRRWMVAGPEIARCLEEFEEYTATKARVH